MNNNNDIVKKVRVHNEEHEIIVIIRNLERARTVNPNTKQRRRRTNYTEKILNDPLIMNA